MSFVFTLHYQFNVLVYVYSFFRVVRARRTCAICIRGKLLLANVLTFWAKNPTSVTADSCLHWFVRKKKIGWTNNGFFFVIETSIDIVLYIVDAYNDLKNVSKMFSRNIFLTKVYGFKTPIQNIYNYYLFLIYVGN